jgi:hypothetical protein
MQQTSSTAAIAGPCRYCGQLQSDLLTHLRQALAEERTLFLAEPPNGFSPVLQTTPRGEGGDKMKLLVGAAAFWSALAVAVARGRARMQQIEELFQVHRTTF